MPWYGISADPAYARAWGRGWRAIRAGFEGEVENERLWISPSWEIYERWCFVRLGRLLEAALPSFAWHSSGPPWVKRGVLGERVVELALQPRFRANSPDGVGRWSVSMEREPDLVLTVTNGTERRFIALDAKYRVSRASVLDAMSSPHIYQDSLRLGDQRPSTSLLLVPAPGGAPWLERPAFHVAHRVGVHVLAHESADLPAVILELLPPERGTQIQ